MTVSLEKEFHENRMKEPKIELTWPNELRLVSKIPSCFSYIRFKTGVINVITY